MYPEVLALFTSFLTVTCANVLELTMIIPEDADHEYEFIVCMAEEDGVNENVALEQFKDEGPEIVGLAKYLKLFVG